MHSYVRWRRGEPRTGQVFPPLMPEHRFYQERCSVCSGPLGDGSPVQLLAIGPEPGDREACLSGRWISAVALLFHAACLGTPLHEL